MEEKMTLMTIADGAAIEKFDAEFERVMANITDPNTSAQKTRKIRLEFEFRPGSSREFVSVKIKSASVLVPETPFESDILLQKENGKVFAVSPNSRQRQIFDEEQNNRKNLEVVNGGVNA